MIFRTKMSRIFYFCWLLYILGATSVVVNGIKFKRSVSLTVSGSLAGSNECVILPATPERTPVLGEQQIDILNLLNGGSENMTRLLKSSVYPQDAILVLGNTGCGKTTLTQILTSNMTNLHAVETQSGQTVIIDDFEKIGAPSVLSRTLVPELVPLTLPTTNNTIYFHDFPGFDDTRGPEQDLAANYFMNKVVRNTKRVKMMFLVLHSSVRAGNDRKDFDLLANHASTFVKDFGPFENSIGLVVTKVKSYNDRGRMMSDGQVLRGILEFLFTYNRTLHQKLNENVDTAEKELISKKIQFVQILLRYDPNSAGYSRISISRSPTQCGPLSNSEMAIRTKAMVTRMYEKLEYGSISHPDIFGYTLKENTKVKIQNYAKQIDAEIGNRVRDTMSAFVQWFDREKFPENLEFSFTLASIENSIQEIKNFVFNSADDVSQFAEGLMLTLGKLGYAVPQEFMNFMKLQADYLTFFEKAQGPKVRKGIKEWMAAVSSIQSTFEEYIVWYRFLLNTKTKLMSYEFQATNKPVFPVQFDGLEFLERHSIVVVEQNVKDVGLKLGPQSKHVRSLDKLIKWTLEPTQVACTEGHTTTVTGNFIRLAEILEGIKGSCWSAGTLKVFAANTVYLDSNLDGVGKEMTVVVIAPEWQVIGRPYLNFNGANGYNFIPVKAQDGSAPGMNGMNGLAGRPGGPGGHFFGVAGQIVEALGLTITANGGNGGNGQDGGDGASGKNGDRHWYSSTHDDVIVFRRKRHGYKGEKGGDGGNGGHGGVGGIGGNPGSIHIISQDSEKVKISQSAGLIGFPGTGGIGAKGGTGAWSQACHTKKIMFRNRSECIDSKEPDGNYGSMGQRGGSTSGQELPRQARSIPDFNFYTNLYKGQNSHIGDTATISFINSL